jgi:hypothetical protein
VKLAERFDFHLQPSPDGWKISVVCLAQGIIQDKEGNDMVNPRSPSVGSKVDFLLANQLLSGYRIMEQLNSLTDDQCDSFFPQAPVKKSKKAKGE